MIGKNQLSLKMALELAGVMRMIKFRVVCGLLLSNCSN